MLNPGIKGSASVAVTTANTAAAMGSGELNVFATPALAALVEKACWQSVAPERRGRPQADLQRRDV